jgi:hypothetical protein
MTGSVHLRGIMIAGALAALALALGFLTLSMNQSASRAAVHTVLPLKQRHASTGATATAAAAKLATAAKPRVKPKPKPNPILVAALQAGLPRSVGQALAARPVVVVQLTSSGDRVAKLANGEAKAGAALAGASFVQVDVDKDGGDVETMTRLLGKLPMAPATLVYARPALLYVTLSGFNDRTTIQQAAANASAPSAAASPTPAAPSAAVATATAAAPTGAG